MTDPREIALPQPSRLGQGTAIEQSRAVAEVYAAVMIARDMPRSTARAIRNMEEACRQPELAARAFYAFPRKGKTVTGASIHLARELARCWGNIQYNVAELRRDDDHGQSELLAYAWDLESNTRPSAIFIVPHKRSGKDADLLTDTRDIYENNANNGARRVRECIFAVLPVWFRERAESLCRETAAKGGGRPHAERVANIIKWLETVNVTEADAARKLGRSSNDWTGADLAELGVLLDSIKQGTVSREEAFPSQLDAEQVRLAATAAVRAQPAAEEDPELDALELARWHEDGHPHDGPPPFNRHAWDPECRLCVDDQVNSLGGQQHYYDHTHDWVDGCGMCEREKAWKDEDGAGG